MINKNKDLLKPVYDDNLAQEKELIIVVKLMEKKRIVKSEKTFKKRSLRINYER